MTQQQGDGFHQGPLSYLRHQGAKSLAELDALMQSAAGAWKGCLQNMNEEQATFHPPPDPEAPVTPVSGEGPKWSAKEVIGHFLLSERSLNQRVAELTGLTGPGAPARAVRAMGEQSADDEAQPIEELRRRLDVFFDETRGFLASLESCDSLEVAFPHPVFGPLTPKEWIAFHRLHSADHIQQIERIKAHPDYPKG